MLVDIGWSEVEPFECLSDTDGCRAASKGKNEFSKTKVEPRLTTPTMTAREAKRYTDGEVIAITRVKVAPVKAKPSRSCLR